MLDLEPIKARIRSQAWDDDDFHVASDFTALIAEVERLRAAPVAEPLTVGEAEELLFELFKDEPFRPGEPDIAAYRATAKYFAEPLVAALLARRPTTGANPLVLVGQTWRRGTWECRITDDGGSYVEMQAASSEAVNRRFVGWMPRSLLTALLSSWSLDGTPVAAVESGEGEANAGALWDALRGAGWDGGTPAEAFIRSLAERANRNYDEANDTLNADNARLRSDLAAAQERIKKAEAALEDCGESHAIIHAEALKNAADLAAAQEQIKAEKLVVDLMTKRGNEFADALLKVVKERDEARAEVERLTTGENWIRPLLVEMHVDAIRGISDAAIVADQTFDARHTVAAVKQLAEFTIGLRTQHAAALDALRALRDYKIGEDRSTLELRDFYRFAMTTVGAALAGLPAQAQPTKET